MLPAFGLPGVVPEIAQQTDWAATRLGPVERWPANLDTAVGVCLGSRFPMIVMWGPELTMIYNDGLLPILGEKHPEAFTAPAAQVWDEIWPVIGPMLTAVRADGASTWSEDLPLALRRDGRLREGHFTFSASPIHDESGAIGGVFVTAVETTHRVLATRRLATLSALARRTTATEPGAEAVLVEAARVLDGNRADVALAGFYLRGSSGVERLSATIGVSPGDDVLPPVLDPDALPWPVVEPDASSVRDAVVVAVGDERNQAILLPLPAADAVVGHVLFAVGALHELDDDLIDFLVAVADRVGAEVGTAAVQAAEQVVAAALAQEQAVLSQVIELAPAGICLWWGPEHRYRLANRTYLKLLSIDDPTGRTVAEVLPAVAPVAVPALDAVRRTGVPQRYEELPLPLGGEGSLDGVRYHTFAISPVPEADGSPGGVLGVTVESTEAVRRRSALEAELLDERRIAETLQRALLPPKLPTLPGATLAARYVAAGDRQQVGGDFYDAFENGDGTWTLIVGDIQGKGPRAAALTAMARYTIRAEAAHGADPGRLVTMLNGEMCRHGQRPGEFCTLVCATVALDGPRARMRVAVAGHPSPIVLRSGRGPSVIGKTGPLAGVMPDASWGDVRVLLGPGDSVVFFTDGLTEARAPEVVLDPVDLAAGLAMIDTGDAAALVSRLAADLPPAEALRDDYAILAFGLDRL